MWWKGYKGYKDIVLHLHLLSSEWWIFVKEEPKKQKKANYALQECKNRLSVYVDEERLETFMRELPIIQKAVH